ncbi:MAG TPA: amidohydrolase family protein, partial [Chitinophagaceae bacterium]|nr:amidohydrolase family protein [Chitinophagaceae bacterium]
MWLQNVNIIGEQSLKQIKIAGDRIEEISASARLKKGGEEELNIIFEGALAFPGLINSHDHLEFNLFPRLGSKIYRNYKEWGPDIHVRNNDTIQSILDIPTQVRVQWGILKNLLNGFTTVVHHGRHLTVDDPLINIFQNCHCLHSIAVENHWRFKLNNPFAKNWPFVIHVGEGTDESAFEEINQLIRWNIFKRKLVGVHGVAMSEQQAKSFEAVVWCPDSNFFLLNTTARVDLLKKQTKTLFGTDSTLSAGWNAWDQIRLAREANMLSDLELFESLTALPAGVWKFQDRGVLAEGAKADIIVAEQKDITNSLDNFFDVNPSSVL